MCARAYVLCVCVRVSQKVSQASGSGGLYMSQASGNGGLNTFTGKWQRKTQAAENGVYVKAPIGLYMSQASMEDAHDFQTEYGMPPAGGRAGSGK